MKLLFAANLKGRRDLYETLVARSPEFTAMFWIGDLIDPDGDDAAEQQARLESAAGEIQARGCRVIASGASASSLDLWRWFDRQGMFVAPGLLITGHPEREDRSRLSALREAASKAGALWIALADAHASLAHTTEVPGGNYRGAYAADRFAPDLIVTTAADGARHRGHEWCQRRAHTWVLVPDAGDPHAASHVILDLRRRRAVRHSRAGRESRDLSALFRARFDAHDSPLQLAA